MSRGQLAAQIGLVADMGEFVFDVKVLVTSFEFSYVQANGLTKSIKQDGYSITNQMKEIIRNLRPGSRATFEDIKVKMPDGETRSLSPIVLKLT